MVVMGSHCTGKSSIVQQYINSSFPLAYTRTVEEVYTTKRLINKSYTELLIYDTPGCQVLNKYHWEALHGCHGIIMLISATDPSSLEYVEDLYAKLGLAKHKVPTLLVLNKTNQITLVEYDAVAQVAKEMKLSVILADARYVEHCVSVFTAMITMIKSVMTVSM